MSVYAQRVWIDKRDVEIDVAIFVWKTPLIARFMESTWGPSGAERYQVGPMLTPWILLFGTRMRTSFRVNTRIRTSFRVNTNYEKYSRGVQCFVYIIIDCLVQDCSISIANAVEMLQSCTKQSKCSLCFVYIICSVSTTLFIYHCFRGYFNKSWTAVAFSRNLKIAPVGEITWRIWVTLISNKPQQTCDKPQTVCMVLTIYCVSCLWNMPDLDKDVYNHDMRLVSQLAKAMR